MLAPREIDEYLLPTERRVIRVRQHWGVMLKHVLQTGLVLLLLVIAERYIPDGAECLAASERGPVSYTHLTLPTNREV